MDISILSLFRNSASYIENTLKLFDALKSNEKSMGFKFKFFFFENDSTDNTPNILKNWTERNNGILYSFKYDAPQYGSVYHKDRFTRLGYYRNKLKYLSIEENISDISIIIDSDIGYFDIGHVKLLTLALDNENIGLATCSTMQDIPCKMGSNKPYSYYDSLALIDINSNQGMTWSFNPFYSKEDRINYELLQPVEVEAAFGSCAAIKTNLLKRDGIEWGQDGTPEHYNFCQSIRDSGKSIVVCPNITPMMYISQKIFDNEHLVIDFQKRKLKIESI